MYLELLYWTQKVYVFPQARRENQGKNTWAPAIKTDS